MTTSAKKCSCCAARIKPPQRQYCSPACRAAARRKPWPAEFRSCQQCGSRFKAAHPRAVYCSPACRQLGYGRPRKHRLCLWCGSRYRRLRGQQQYCSARCRLAAKWRRRADAAGTPLDRTLRRCLACGRSFSSRKSNQRYCDMVCRNWASASRCIDRRGRKTAADPFVSPAMLARRAEAQRQLRSEGQRQRRDKLLPAMPLLKPRPAISQAARVKSHIETGNYYGALKIARKWPKLGDARPFVADAWAALQQPRDAPGAAELIAAGIWALRRHLKMPDEDSHQPQGSINRCAHGTQNRQAAANDGQ